MKTRILHLFILKTSKLSLDPSLSFKKKEMPQNHGRQDLSGHITFTSIAVSQLLFLINSL